MIKKVLLLSIASMLSTQATQVYASNNDKGAQGDSALGVPAVCSKYKFDRNQIAVLKESYELGLPFGFGYTLAAIAWQESLAGKYLMNVDDPSFGVHHILISSASNRANIRGIERNRLAKAIIDNSKLSASFAIEELSFWKTELKGDNNRWENIWAAYNGGYNYKSDRAQAYSSSIGNKIGWLKTCLIK